MRPRRDPLRARLGDLTLLDEHRLGRRLERARDDRTRERLEREIAAAEAADRAPARRGAGGRAIRPSCRSAPAARICCAAIRDHQVVVVAGETGSGKTTQLPKICLELGRGVRGAIGHTQPRRLAARTVAERIAEELDVPLGEAVGYAVRFNDRSGQDTLVRLMTDGLLLAEIRATGCCAATTRSSSTRRTSAASTSTSCSATSSGSCPPRPDLKLIITSATIDPERFAAHFGDAPVVEVSGPHVPRRGALPARRRGHRPGGCDRRRGQRAAARGPGDVLVFLSGEREIRDTAEALGGRVRDGVEILPLYARLSTRRSGGSSGCTPTGVWSWRRTSPKRR